MALMMANAGGAWDNAKKHVEKGNFGGKGTDVHAATVVGDTVGDPFKDTSGPSMNILIKLTCLIGLVIAPILGDGHGQWDKEGEVWCTEAEAHVLESYPAERYDQEKVMEVIKDFFPTPYHYSTINSSDSKVNDNFKVEIDGAMKADDDVKVDDEYDL